MKNPKQEKRELLKRCLKIALKTGIQKNPRTIKRAALLIYPQWKIDHSQY